MGRSRDRRRDQQQAWCYAKAGQALPEFVLVLPILILIFMGVLDLGRAFHTHVAVSNAARVGVIYAQQVTTPGAGNCASDTWCFVNVNDIINKVKSEAQGGIDASQMNVGICLQFDPVCPATVMTETVAENEAITISVSVPFTSILPYSKLMPFVRPSRISGTVNGRTFPFQSAPGSTSAVPPTGATTANITSLTTAVNTTTVPQGGSQTFTATVTADPSPYFVLANARIDFRVYLASDTAYANTIYESQVTPATLAASTPETFTTSWTPPMTQTTEAYVLKVDVFGPSGYPNTSLPGGSNDPTAASNAFAVTTPPPVPAPNITPGSTGSCYTYSSPTSPISPSCVGPVTTCKTGCGSANHSATISWTTDEPSARNYVVLYAPGATTPVTYTATPGTNASINFVSNGPSSAANYLASNGTTPYYFYLHSMTTGGESFSPTCASGNPGCYNGGAGSRTYFYMPP